MARAMEEERVARIEQGAQHIKTAFQGYNDKFFDNYKQQNIDYYNPQLNDQYSDAVKRLTLQLAQTGNLTGSVGADQQAKLQKTFDQQKMAISGQAMEAANKLRADVDSRRSQLYADNRASADPGGTYSQAANISQLLTPAAPSSPLADVFGDFFSQLGNQAALKNGRLLSQNVGVQSFGGRRSGGNVDVIG